MIHGDAGDVARGKFTVCELEHGWSDGPFRLISCRNWKNISYYYFFYFAYRTWEKHIFYFFKLMPGGRFQQPLLKLAWTHRDIIFSDLKKDLNWRHMMETISHEITCFHFNQDLKSGILDFPSWMIWKGALHGTLWGTNHSFPEQMFPLNQSIDAMKKSEPCWASQLRFARLAVRFLRPTENHLRVPSAAGGIRRAAWMNARPKNSTVWRAGAAMMLERLLIHLVI